MIPGLERPIVVTHMVPVEDKIKEIKMQPCPRCGVRLVPKRDVLLPCVPCRNA